MDHQTAENEPQQSPDEDTVAPKGVRRGFYPTDRLQGAPRARFGAGRRGSWPTA
ncbi:MAG: hypothetical protein AAF480_10910 [Actinomycetota bacterium]